MTKCVYMYLQEPIHQKLAPLTCKGQKLERQQGVTLNAMLDHINTIAPPKVAQRKNASHVKSRVDLTIDLKSVVKSII